MLSWLPTPGLNVERGVAANTGTITGIDLRTGQFLLGPRAGTVAAWASAAPTRWPWTCSAPAFLPAEGQGRRPDRSSSRCCSGASSPTVPLGPSPNRPVARSAGARRTSCSQT